MVRESEVESVYALAEVAAALLAAEEVALLVVVAAVVDRSCTGPEPALESESRSQ
jgi:hypothetical protein